VLIGNLDFEEAVPELVELLCMRPGLNYALFQYTNEHFEFLKKSEFHIHHWIVAVLIEVE